MVSSFPHTVPIFGSIWPASTSAWMKFGSSRTSGFKRQHPLPAGERDGLILRRRETDVLIVVDDPAAILELLQDVHRSVGRRVVDDDDFQVRILLLQNRFQAPLDESAAVIR